MRRNEARVPYNYNIIMMLLILLSCREERPAQLPQTEMAIYNPNMEGYLIRWCSSMLFHLYVGEIHKSQATITITTNNPRLSKLISRQRGAVHIGVFPKIEFIWLPSN